MSTKTRFIAKSSKNTQSGGSGNVVVKMFDCQGEIVCDCVLSNSL